MDTTLMPIRSLSPVIINRLQKVFPKNKFKVERCQPTLSMDEFNRLTRLTPYIGLACCGFRTNPDAGEYLSGSVLWRLVIVCKASGDYDRRIKGDAFDIGLDDIMDVATVILHGYTFEDIGCCSVEKSEVVYSEGTSRNACVLAQIDFNIQTTITTGSLKLETPEEFHGLKAFWMLSDQTNQNDGENDE